MDLAERNESFQTTVPQREKEKRKNPTLPHILTGNFLGHFKTYLMGNFLEKKVSFEAEHEIIYDLL